MARIVVLSPLPGEAVQGMFSEAGGRGDIVVEVYDGDPGPGLVEADRKSVV